MLHIHILLILNFLAFNLNDCKFSSMSHTTAPEIHLDILPVLFKAASSCCGFAGIVLVPRYFVMTLILELPMHKLVHKGSYILLFGKAVMMNVKETR